MNEKYIFIFIFLLILFYFILFNYINNYLRNMTNKKLENITIKFDYTPSEINKIKNSIVKNQEDWLITKKKQLNNNKNIKITNKDSENFLNSYLYLDNKYDYIIDPINILQYVSSDDSITNASINFTLDLINLSKKFYEDIDNYKLFKYYLNNNFIKTSVNPLIKKLCKDILRQFEDNGVHLDNEKRKIFTKLNKELDLYENDFSQNIMNDTKIVKFTKVELDGISEDVLKLHQSKDKLKKDYIFTTSYPDYSEILKNCNIRESREKINFEFNTVAKSNLELLVKILVCRNNISQLLNYKSSCNFYLSDNHIANKNAIMKMINKVSPILMKLSKKEYDNLTEYVNTSNSNFGQLKNYDIPYYSNKLLKQKYDIDNNLVKQYFTPSYSIPKILSIYCKLFGLKYNLIKNCPKWHEDVFVYKFSDSKTNELIGYIYFDLYPRPKKYTHAMTTPLQDSYQIICNNNNKRIIPVSAIVCNFDKKFMTTAEIQTFCHEFGHGLHQILSKAKYERYAGTSTELDFSEMPSQLFENWCREPSFLQQISHHYITHKKIPLELAKKIKKNKNFNNGLYYLRQILLMNYDLEVHLITNKEITKDTLYRLWYDLYDKFYPYKLDKNLYPMCRFEHLIGYQANYYSYMWTNIYAMDIFSKFKKNGIYDTKTGIKFRKEIFEKGGEVDGKVMIETFLGRKVKEDSFFELFD